MFLAIVKKLLYLFSRQIFSVFWFFLYVKLLLFWAWLWQLKEYHLGRFKAHFETQKFRKIASSFWRLKFPRLTPKIAIILFSNVLLGFFILFFISYLNCAFFISRKEFYFSLLALIILAPLLFLLSFLFFQIPSQIWQKRLLKKARRKREKFEKLLAIGITGSYGKTSTKEILATILSEKFKVLKTKEHINAEVGIANTILKELTSDYEVLVTEIGAYERGKIKQVCQMLQPKIGILAGINEQHMSTFGSQENIIKAKFELIEALPENGIAVLNWDNKIIQKSKIKNQNENLKFKIIKYSIFQKEDVWTEDVNVGKTFLSFKVFTKDGDSAFFKTNLLGGHNISNILGAVAVAKEWGMNLEEISKACERIEPFEKTMQLKKGRGGVTIIDDTYSANPAGVIAALDYLKLYSGPVKLADARHGVNKKIIVMPCLIELGKASKEVHKRIGERIGKVCDLVIITTKDRFKEIKEGAMSVGMKENDILFLENPQEIFGRIKSYLSPSFAKASEGKENVILLESRVPNQLISLLVR